VTPRIWALAAAVWTAIYVGSYIAIVHGKHDAVLSVYAIVVLVAGLLVLPTGMQGATARRANLMLVALVIYVLAVLAALPFGLILLPALVATARALSKIKRGAPPADAAAR
jgi:threonine/homoserine efflux transporter RhtA